MTDINKKTMGDDEYQFPSDEYIADSVEQTEETHAEFLEEEEAPQKQRIGSGLADRLAFLKQLPVLKNKRVVVVIVAAVVVLIAFQFLGGFGGHKKAKQQVTQKVTQPKTTANVQVNGQLSELKQDTVSNLSSIQQVQTQISGLNKAVKESNTASTALNQSVQSLEMQVRQLTALVKEEANRPRSKKAGSPAPKITYQLLAVVPGRAWLEGSNHISTTVRVGDHLKQYGTITAINASHGLVFTSSGKVIQYGPEDS